MILRTVIASWLFFGSTMWCAEALPGHEPGRAWRSYRVQLTGIGYPSWFGQLAVGGLQRADSSESADVIVAVYASNPVVYWTSWGDTNEPATSLGTLRWRVPSLGGVGDHMCQFIVRDRSTGKVITTFDIAVHDTSVRWLTPQPDYRLNSDLFIITPAGRALAWGQQAWAQIYQQAEQQLALRFGPNAPK